MNDKKFRSIWDDFYKRARPHKYPSDQPNTNYTAYKKLLKLTILGENITHDIITMIFNLKPRTRIDLLNLKEFIMCITLMGICDVLQAGMCNKQQEQAEIKNHEMRCELMTAILTATDKQLSMLG